MTPTSAAEDDKLKRYNLSDQPSSHRHCGDKITSSRCSSPQWALWRKCQLRTTALWRQHKTTSGQYSVYIPSFWRQCHLKDKADNPVKTRRNNTSQYSVCIPSFWRERQLWTTRTTTLRRQDKTTSQYSACIPSFWRKRRLRTTRMGTLWRHPGTDDSSRLCPDVPSSAHVEQSLGTDCSSKRPRPFPCSSQSHVSGWKAHCKWVTSILIFCTSVRRNWNRREAKETRDKSLSKAQYCYGYVHTNDVFKRQMERSVSSFFKQTLVWLTGCLDCWCVDPIRETQNKMSTFAFRCFKIILPPYLSSLLTTYAPSRSLRSSNKRFLSVPVTNAKKSVPTHIHSSDTLSALKNRPVRKSFLCAKIHQTFPYFVNRIVMVLKSERFVFTYQLWCL